MTKSQIAKKLAETYGHLPTNVISSFVDKAFALMSEALVKGDRIELRGFGAFSVRKRAARLGRNPRTGEHVRVEAKRVPFFKLGKPFLDHLNNK